MEIAVTITCIFVLLIVVFLLIYNSFSIKSIQKDMSTMDLEQNKLNFRLFIVEKKMNHNNKP
jgi:hypothetical protein